MPTQTSLLAYAEVKPKLGERQKRVLNVLKLHGPANNRMISEWAHLPINCTTPRVLELRELGLVEEADKDLDPASGRLTMYWKATEQ